MSKSNELLCAHSGLAFGLLMAIGIFGIAGWLPVHDPSWSAEHIARIFQDDRTRIQIGMMTMASAAVLFWPFAAAISTQLRRVEGRDSHPLTYVQMASATGTVMAILIPAYSWLAVTYRPGDPSPETMQLVNDFNWFNFVGMFPPAVIQNLAIGICILSDRSDRPLFPRWLGIANLVEASVYMVGFLMPFSQVGLFAWNGLIGFWAVAILFFGWLVTMWWATVRAIKTTLHQAGDPYIDRLRR